jgi:hypothetical protein
MRKRAASETSAKKEYKKPEVRKHKSVAVVSGSGCSYSNSRSNFGTYYH